MIGSVFNSGSKLASDSEEFTAAAGTVTFYVDNRCKADRRQPQDRRKSPRITPDRRSLVSRRQQTMTWNNGYQFQSPNSGL